MIKSAPVGPVAGGIMGCIMVLVLAVYAYRHQIHRRSHQHMSPLAAQGECREPLLSGPVAGCVGLLNCKGSMMSAVPKACCLL